MNFNKYCYNLFKRKANTFICYRHIYYKQGQIKTNTREYFYYIDHNGQVRISI